MKTNLSLPAVVADHLFAPTELPSPESDLEAFLGNCNQRINWLICEAWINGVLPERTALVQCLTRSPIRGRIDFRHPWILKRGDQADKNRLRLLAAFAHTTWHLTRREASSHARMRDEGDTSRGAIVIFTKEMPESSWPGGVSHVLHFGFPGASWPKSFDFADCASDLMKSDFYCPEVLGSFTDEFDAFDSNKFVNFAETAGKRSIIEDRPAPCKWNGRATAAMKAQRPERISDLFKKIRDDNIYQDRVAVLLEYGAIVLCAPQSMTFPTETLSDESVILDSGLTVILSNDSAPTFDEIHRINAVAQKISLFIGSTYGLAKKLAHESERATANKVLGMIGHSLDNTFSNRARADGELERAVLLESINLKAAADLFAFEGTTRKPIEWDKGGFERAESVGDLICKGVFKESAALQLECENLAGQFVDKRFASLLIELCENLSEHSKSGSIHVLMDGTDGRDTANRRIIVKGYANNSDMQKMAEIISGYFLHGRRNHLIGFDFILLLAQQIALHDKASIVLSFADEGNCEVLRFTGSRHSHRFVFRKEIERKSQSSDYLMNLTFNGLLAIV
jgi:hypothetical protein